MDTSGQLPLVALERRHSENSLLAKHFSALAPCPPQWGPWGHLTQSPWLRSFPPLHMLWVAFLSCLWGDAGSPRPSRRSPAARVGAAAAGPRPPPRERPRTRLPDVARGASPPGVWLSRPAQLQERDSAASTGLGGSPRVCSPGCTAAVPGRSDRDGAGSAVQQAPSAGGVTAHPSGGGTSAPRLAGRGQVDTAVMAGRSRRRSGGARRDGRA